MRVRFEGVEKRYGQVPALSALELSVNPGELLVLVGPSGSGKSTALGVLAGLEEPTAGRVLIGDRDVTRLAPHRRNVAMVFQDYALYPHLTARDNLTFGLRVRREPRSAERVTEVAGQLDIAELLDRYPDQLSGGQRQRVALARAMIHRRKRWLMPTLRDWTGPTAPSSRVCSPATRWSPSPATSPPPRCACASTTRAATTWRSWRSKTRSSRRRPCSTTPPTATTSRRRRCVGTARSYWAWSPPTWTPRACRPRGAARSLPKTERPAVAARIPR
ncbi:MAG: ABC transporter ATP-binding protein, partial [Euzebyales bacterium]|nr:ABC transporter ATP-binding protein [Euzebyales bacterium]